MITTIRAALDEHFDVISASTNHYIANTTIHVAYGPVTPAELRAQRTPRHPFLVFEETGGLLRLIRRWPGARAASHAVAIPRSRKRALVPRSAPSAS